MEFSSTDGYVTVHEIEWGLWDFQQLEKTCQGISRRFKVPIFRLKIRAEIMFSDEEVFGVAKSYGKVLILMPSQYTSNETV